MNVEKAVGEKRQDLESVESWLKAASLGDVSWAKRFLEDGLLVDSASEDGETALMRAAMFGQLEMIDFLIVNGCDVDATDGSGTTALMEAAAWGKSACLRRLLAEGARLEGSKASALIYVVIGATNEPDASGARECLELLLDAGADLGAVDSAGKTAMGIAKENGVAWAEEVLCAEGQRRSMEASVGEGLPPRAVLRV